MKHLPPFIISLIILLSACEMNKPEIKNDVFDISTDSLFVRCAELKGLGNLHIDKTVMKDLRTDTGLSTYNRYYIESDFYSGFWGVKDFELRDYIKKNVKSIKQVEIGSLGSPYKIGEFNLEDIQLAFLNDTLVAISLGSRDYYTIKDAMIQKYGDGQGHYRWYLLTNGKYGEDGLSLEKEEEEVRVWENESVKFDRYYYWKSKIVKQQEVFPSVSKEYCLIYSKHRYSEFEKRLNDAKETYKSILAKRNEESVNLL